MFKDFIIDDFENSAKQLEKLIVNNKKELDNILKQDKKTYANFVVPYQKLSLKLEEFITPIFHLDSVKNTKLTQQVHNECLPLISIYSSQLMSNEKIYSAFKDIQLNENSSLNIEQQKVLENEIREFELGGCGLDKQKKKELENINLRLSELSQSFSQNVLDATNSWEMILDNKEDIKEIPKSDLQNAMYIDKDQKEKYRFTLQIPSYLAYITYGSNREKREEIYKAYSTRAPQNEQLIEEILNLREKEALLLGFKNYTQLSLATKMANEEQEVINFLYDISKYAKPKAKQELQELKEFAYKLDGVKELKSYDIAYYSQKLKEKNYDIDEEYYKPYFEQSKVVEGLFEFLNKFLDITIIKSNTPAWDEKVKVYNINENNKTIARLYLDLEVRDDKKSGAWMNNWHTHCIMDNEEKLATAFVVCNFSPSTQSNPSLLRHDDIVTLFHEMGHALHHLLSDVKEPFVSGINGVKWDTVEFPSQFLEYFAYDKDILQMFAKHYKTNKILDDDSIEKLIVARNFQSSLTTLRQIEFALFDFKLYQHLYNTNEVQILLDTIRDEIAVVKPPRYNKFQNSFSHIFAGGYAAGYYSYKWAEVLSASGFDLFREKGVLNTTLSSKYKEFILKKGGSVDMDKLFIKFANKTPNIEALLKIDGIIS